jgi:hypothetical protein
MKVGWKQTMLVWWSFFWRALLYGMLAGAALGFFAGLFAAISGVPDRATLYGAIAGYLGALPASMLALKQALGKNWAVLSTAAAPNAS